MNHYPELSDRVFKTRFAPLNPDLKILEEMSMFGGGFELTLVTDGYRDVIGLLFNNTEDLLAFKIKYGNKYA